MPTYVRIVAYLTPDELEQRYRQADDPVERSHLQIVWLLACDKRVREVTEVTGYCANWIRMVARRYNQKGPEAVADQRQYNGGASALLSRDQQQQLQQVLTQAPADGGLWSGPKVAQWMGKTDWTRSPSPAWLGVSQESRLLAPDPPSSSPQG